MKSISDYLKEHQLLILTWLGILQGADDGKTTDSIAGLRFQAEDTSPNVQEIDTKEAPKPLNLSVPENKTVVALTGTC